MLTRNGIRYPVSGYIMSHGVEPFKKDQFEGAVPTVFAVTKAEDGGNYICAPATMEETSEMGKSEELMENLMDLTKKLVFEKTAGEVVAF